MANHNILDKHHQHLQVVHQQLTNMLFPLEKRIQKEGYVVINGIFNVKPHELYDTYTLEDDYTCTYNPQDNTFIKRYHIHRYVNPQIPHAKVRKAKYRQYQSNGEWFRVR